jgi:non-heme chloroperoxidase
MQRRNALKAAATLLAGAGVSSIANGSVKRPSAQYPATKRSRFPYLEVGERTTLFFKDWGMGAPVVVFVHGWPLHSDMWQYQISGAPHGLFCYSHGHV